MILTMACWAKLPAANSTDAQNDRAGQKPPAAETNKANLNELRPKPEMKTSVDSCPDVKLAGKLQIKSQTFPFNFEPFPDSCFVTFASVEQMVDKTDVPRGSTFHLYQRGRLVLDLPDAFDAQEACWVEGVSFKDLNGDGLTDIVIAGSCLGARDSYASNAIFVNNGDDFTTNATANGDLADLKKLSAIEAFVKRNQKLFF
jgi:hypothetical protein